MGYSAVKIRMIILTIAVLKPEIDPSINPPITLLLRSASRNASLYPLNSSESVSVRRVDAAER